MSGQSGSHRSARLGAALLRLSRRRCKRAELEPLGEDDRGGTSQYSLFANASRALTIHEGTMCRGFQAGSRHCPIRFCLPHCRAPAEGALSSGARRAADAEAEVA